MAKFKVGDRVKVIKNITGTKGKDEFIGNAYTIQDLDSVRELGQAYSIGKYYIVYEDELEFVEFTKSDLKNGMVVEDKEADRFFVLGEMLIDDCRRRDFDDYYDNLLHKEDVDLDIVKVYSVDFGEVYALEDLIYDDGCLELIWERTEEHKEMTVEEIEEKLGYKIKVVADK